MNDATSVVAIDCRGKGWTVGTYAFIRFGGTHTEIGEGRSCADWAGYTPCADGGLALTPPLYKLGPDVYKDATCIPNYAFCQDHRNANCVEGKAFTGDVVLNGLEHLKSVGDKAFSFFKAKLTIKGNFPAWTEIGAFSFATDSSSSDGSFASMIDLSNARALKTVDEEAFHSYKGTVKVDGAYPDFDNSCGLMLPGGGVLHAPGVVPLTPSLYQQEYPAYKDATCIPDYAFCQNTGDNSYCEVGTAFTGDVVLNGLEHLKSVGYRAFQNFKGKLTIQGSFLPGLRLVATLSPYSRTASVGLSLTCQTYLPSRRCTNLLSIPSITRVPSRPMAPTPTLTLRAD
jgi:hypothetical protein